MRHIYALAVAFVATALLVPAAAEAGRSAIVDLRVLTPDAVLEEGTSYVVGKEKVRTDPDADCNFGGTGGTGASYAFPRPTALGLLQAASEQNPDLTPLSLTDEFGFGLAICGIGGVDDAPGTFWGLRKNRKEANQGADILRVRDGDEVIYYLTPDNFPNPNPGVLDLEVAPRAEPGTVVATVTLTRCASDPESFEFVCDTVPAEGVTVSGGTSPAITGAGGTATVPVATSGGYGLQAMDPPSIPSRTLQVCVDEDLRNCPKAHGKAIVGRDVADRITDGRGPDRIRGLGGDDRIKITQGGDDVVSCGGGRDTVVRETSDRGDEFRGCERVVHS